MGVGPHIKYSLGTATSQLAKAVSQSTDLPFAVSEELVEIHTKPEFNAHDKNLSP